MFCGNLNEVGEVSFEKPAFGRLKFGTDFEVLCSLSRLRISRSPDDGLVGYEVWLYYI